MRFLIDAQLPPALARWLAARGHEAKHVMDLGMEAASDHAIWIHATQQNAVIVTKDEDFAIWRTQHTGTQPAVVWLRIGNTRRQTLLRWLEPLLPRIMDQLDRGEKLVEIR